MNESYRSDYRIFVQDIEQHLAGPGDDGVEEIEKTERVFNILNKRTRRGKKPPMVCKFIDSLSELSHGLTCWFEGSFYLLEGRELRNRVFAGVGLRIAFLVAQPVLIRIPRRKG
jgi:hypothetical protein